eukprot:9475112-Pyramimonas_sp.AAC.1
MLLQAGTLPLSFARPSLSSRPKSFVTRASLASEKIGMGKGQVIQRVVTLKPQKRGIYLMTRKIYEEVPELKNIQAGTANLFLKIGPEVVFEWAP